MRHDDEIAVAICSLALAGVGLDIEKTTAPTDDIRTQVMTASELDDPEWSDESGTLRLFSYKEAMFKCIYPLIGQFLDFTDVQIYRVESGIKAHCPDTDNPAARWVSSSEGFIEQTPGRIVSACWLLHNPGE